MNLNVGLEEGVPACPLPGHNWGDVVHSNSGTWLVNWKSSLNDAGKYIFEILSNIRKNRYVFLAASSSFKGKSDMNKYEKVWNEIRVYCIGKNAKEIYHQDSPRNKEEYEIIGSTIEVWIGKCRDEEGIDNVQPQCG